MRILIADPGLRRPAEALGAALRLASVAPDSASNDARMRRINRLIDERTGRLRRSALLAEHAGLVSPSGVFERTDAIRTLQRSAHHAERAIHYGLAATGEAQEASQATEPS